MTRSYPPVRSSSGVPASSRWNAGLVEDRDALLLGLVELGAGLLAGDQRRRLGGDAAADLGAERLEALLGLIAREGLERAGDDEREAGQRRATRPRPAPRGRCRCGRRARRGPWPAARCAGCRTTPAPRRRWWGRCRRWPRSARPACRRCPRACAGGGRGPSRPWGRRAGCSAPPAGARAVACDPAAMPSRSLSTLFSCQPLSSSSSSRWSEQAEHVGQVVEPAERAQLRDRLLAEALDVEGAARREVDERLADAARAVDVLAEVVALALRSHERLPAGRALRRHAPGLGALRPQVLARCPRPRGSRRRRGGR